MQKFANLVRIAFWLLLAAVILWQLTAPRALERGRAAALPRSVYELMDLYPQTDDTKPSVWYVPLPHSPSPKESS